MSYSLVFLSRASCILAPAPLVSLQAPHKAPKPNHQNYTPLGHLSPMPNPTMSLQLAQAALRTAGRASPEQSRTGQSQVPEPTAQAPQACCSYPRQAPQQQIHRTFCPCFRFALCWGQLCECKRYSQTQIRIQILLTTATFETLRFHVVQISGNFLPKDIVELCWLFCQALEN